MENIILILIGVLIFWAGFALGLFVTERIAEYVSKW